MKNTQFQKPLFGLMGLCSAVALTAAPLPLRFEWDAFQANGIIKYDVPADAPRSIVVQATFALADGEFKPAAVNPLRSETAIRAPSTTSLGKMFGFFAKCSSITTCERSA